VEVYLHSFLNSVLHDTSDQFNFMALYWVKNLGVLEIWVGLRGMVDL